MTTILTCEQFDQLLPDWLEGTLAASDRDRAESHRATCVRCTGLVADLESIRTNAAGLPPLSPSRDLWAGIEARIEAPVVSITPLRAASGGRRAFGYAAAAAVALMVLSSGVTYQFAKSRFERVAPAALASAPILPGAMVPAPPASGAVVASAPASEPTTNRPTVLATRPQPAARSLQLVARSAVQAVSRRKLSPSAAYDKDVNALRRILAERRDGLDPRTVAILESSLVMIDRAIAQSRKALSQDPASAFLRDQLNNALDKKVELLRTAALLPART